MDLQSLEHLTAVERSPDILSGAWRFRGTRIPVAALFENLRDGATVTEFLAWFPGVTKEQVDEVLDYEVHALQSPVAP
ncbi:MAG TPA: DUF433 domain-containing protein [Ktedonobacterales bacterium]|nr:DUF433 domain-containing protein [Ktedonobacterales bacterium]